jgi:ribonucleoside-diphosphate reductase alpha chain
VSADDSDICNLGGLNLAHFDDPQQFEDAVRLGALFLTAGTVYSDVPYAQVAAVREKNRRLGLDIIGVHEFLLKRGVRYGTDEAFEVLEPFMERYDRALEFAWDWQDSVGLSRSVAATSGAPTGTRAIIAETTTAWEPASAVAYKRQVITSKAHEADYREVHYVVDPTIARLVKQGYILPTDEVEDSFSLAEDYERRFAMQAYAQSHTDQAISMTVNLPCVMTDPKDRRTFGETLYKYLPKLRGITVYPNGAISGQPITPVPLAEALAAANVILEEDEDKCASGVCGI